MEQEKFIQIDLEPIVLRALIHVDRMEYEKLYQLGFAIEGAIADLFVDTSRSTLSYASYLGSRSNVSSKPLFTIIDSLISRTEGTSSSEIAYYANTYVNWRIPIDYRDRVLQQIDGFFPAPNRQQENSPKASCLSE
jgi:hypothetical protein